MRLASYPGSNYAGEGFEPEYEASLYLGICAMLIQESLFLLLLYTEELFHADIT